MRYVLTALACVAVLVLAYMFVPVPEVAAGSYHWEAGAAMKDQNGDWLIWAELKDGNDDVVQTVRTGTTDSRRGSRKASKKLAESMNEAGSGFKWDPACEGAIFLC